MRSLFCQWSQTGSKPPALIRFVPALVRFALESRRYGASKPSTKTRSITLIEPRMPVVRSPCWSQ